MPPDISPVALTGFSKATSYDAHRPSYPPAAVSALLKHLEIDNELQGRIVDLAAGTGKFTELLTQREEGYEILAVEPHEGMRGVLEGKGLKGVKVLEGSAEIMMGVEKGWAAAVIVAQAFHWFAKDEALQEIYRVLKPGGALGLIWNAEDYNSPKDWPLATEWEGKLREIIWTVGDPAHQFRHMEWRKVFYDRLKSNPLTMLTADPIFSLPLGEDSVKWTVWLTKDAIWERFRTLSHIANLEEGQLEETRSKVFEAMTGTDVETNEQGEVTLHGQTLYCWTTAIPEAPLREWG